MPMSPRVVETTEVLPAELAREEARIEAAPLAERVDISAVQRLKRLPDKGFEHRNYDIPSRCSLFMQPYDERFPTIRD